MTGNNTLRQRRSPGNESNNLPVTYFDNNNRTSKFVGSMGDVVFPSDEIKISGNYDTKDDDDSPQILRITTSSETTAVAIDSRINENKNNDPSSNSAFTEALTIKHGNYKRQKNPFRQTSYHSKELKESEQVSNTQRRQTDNFSNGIERITNSQSDVENIHSISLNDPIHHISHGQSPTVPCLALGHLSFGASLFVLMVHFTHILPSSRQSNHDAIVVMCSIIFGGILQILSGLHERNRSNIFYYTTFCFYGALSLAIGTYYIVSILSNASRTFVRPSAPLLRVICILIVIITILFFVLTFNLNKTVSALYLSLILSCVFFTAVVSDNDDGQELRDSFRYVGGYLGIIAAIISMWLSLAELWNDVYGGGKEIIPLGQWQEKVPNTGMQFVTGNDRRSPTISQRTSHNNDGKRLLNPNIFHADSDESEEIFFSIADIENDIVVPSPMELSTNSQPTQHGSQDNVPLPTMQRSGDKIGIKGKLKDAVSSYVAYSTAQQAPTTGAFLRRLSASPRRIISPTSGSIMDYETKKNRYHAVNTPDTRAQPQHLPLAPNLTATETAPSISSATSTSSDYTENLAISLTTKPFRVTQF